MTELFQLFPRETGYAAPRSDDRKGEGVGGIQKFYGEGAEGGTVVALADLGAHAPPLQLDLGGREDERLEKTRQNVAGDGEFFRCARDIKLNHVAVRRGVKFQSLPIEERIQFSAHEAIDVSDQDVLGKVRDARILLRLVKTARAHVERKIKAVKRRILIRIYGDAVFAFLLFFHFSLLSARFAHSS